VSQLSEPLRSSNQGAKRIFGDIDVGKTMFAGSNIQNGVKHNTMKKIYNCCELGASTSLAHYKEFQAREQFFRGDWM